MQILPLLLSMLVIAVPAVSQTCPDNLPASTPDDRFIVNFDGTVTDTATGLMWKRCNEGLTGPTCSTSSEEPIYYNYYDASAVAETATFAGFADWRLPNYRELTSIYEFCVDEPHINTTIFPGTVKAYTWSNSPDVNRDNSGFFVAVFGSTIPPTENTAAVRLVRDGKVIEDEDGDDDGYLPHLGDCDDTNPAIHPYATEICGDGVDNDCDDLLDGADPDCGLDF